MRSGLLITIMMRIHVGGDLLLKHRVGGGHYGRDSARGGRPTDDEILYIYIIASSLVTM